jgi:hypothetical protein
MFHKSHRKALKLQLAGGWYLRLDKMLILLQHLKKQTWCGKRIHLTKYYIFAILEICQIKSK